MCCCVEAIKVCRVSLHKPNLRNSREPESQLLLSSLSLKPPGGRRATLLLGSMRRANPGRTGDDDDVNPPSAADHESPARERDKIVAWQ